MRARDADRLLEELDDMQHITKLIRRFNFRHYIYSAYALFAGIARR